MDIAAYIDHTLLKPEMTRTDLDRLCTEAKQAGFAAVCVPPYYVKAAKALLDGSSVKTATVIGFPFGYSATPAKLAEIEQALNDGADELDMVHNLAALKSGDYDYLEREITACVPLVHDAGKTLKLIVESSILTDDEVVRCCGLYEKHNIDFMKTSTGYAAGGATEHAVKLMREHLPQRVSIKASGGIRNFTFAKQLIDAGATRIGCSASMQILSESRHIDKF